MLALGIIPHDGLELCQQFLAADREVFKVHHRPPHHGVSQVSLKLLNHPWSFRCMVNQLLEARQYTLPRSRFSKTPLTHSSSLLKKVSRQYRMPLPFSGPGQKEDFGPLFQSLTKPPQRVFGWISQPVQTGISFVA